MSKSDLPLMVTVLNKVFSIKKRDFKSSIMLPPENTPPSLPPIPNPNCAANDDKFPPPVPFYSKAKLSLAV